ncbi:hypothetical protein LTR36_002162 [Oleoguttula mirabilis]|uniref:Uncharacterized protein n=1 Tax=Oleoguttula mirabilis TaxID=1507867 RepID=A0AAV9JKJ6_9PEZI|nr:hypothetical protein LTR36_002162 [Oleoguttula mirabilis]
MESLITATSTGNQGSQEPCFLFTLPQELQDIIFAYAYPKKETAVNIIFKLGWGIKQKEKKRADRANYAVQEFPAKVKQWLVSKAYFTNAARAYMSAQEWDEGVSGMLGSGHGLFCQHAQSIALVSFRGLKDVRSYRSLKVLRIWVEDDDFDEVEDKCPWEDVFAPADFEQLKLTKYLRSLPGGLERLKLLPEWCGYANADAKQATWEANVKALQQFVWLKVNRPKAEVEKAKILQANPLYLGSRVCEERSGLLPQRARGWLDDQEGGSGSSDDEEGCTELSERQSQMQCDPGPSACGPKDGLERKEKEILVDNDIPGNKEDFLRMMKYRGSEVMAWVRSKKL